MKREFSFTVIFSAFYCYVTTVDCTCIFGNGSPSATNVVVLVAVGVIVVIRFSKY